MYGKTILLLSPHPDDEVVGAGAAIGRARAEGSRVLVAFLTTGVPDIRVLWPWQRAGHAARVARRRVEAEDAARSLGFAVALIQDIPTRHLKSHLAATRAALLDIVAREHVDTIWAPAYEGAHQDHDAASFLAWTLRDRAPVWEFAEYTNQGGRARSQDFPCASGAEVVLALTPDEVAAKRRALGAYPSERGNLKHIEAAREVFRPFAGYDYAKPPHPGVLFYQRFQWVWPRHPRVDYTKADEVCAALAAFRWNEEQ